MQRVKKTNENFTLLINMGIFKTTRVEMLFSVNISHVGL